MFSWDNERPAHTVFLQDFQIDPFPVTCAEYVDFISDGGYQHSCHWLEDGWKTVQKQQWTAPLYWEKRDDQWWVEELSGWQSVASRADTPVCHVSYYEAQAFAKWSGRRLPTEAEWEKAACFSAQDEQKNVALNCSPNSGNFMESNLWQPHSARHYKHLPSPSGAVSMMGNVWECVGMDAVRLRALPWV